MKPVHLALAVVIACALVPPAAIPWFGQAGVPIRSDPGVAIIPVTCEDPDPSGAGLVISPAATGAIADMPEMGIRVLAPTGEDMQSSYFRTTQANREFRRGFAEFRIPIAAREVVHATLILGEGPGSISPGAPPESHELSWYAADLSVDVQDYDQPTAFLTGFPADPLDPNEVWRFDVTAVVRMLAGGCLGFRVKLAFDPEHAGYDGMGTSFGRYTFQPPEIDLEYDEFG